MADYDSSEQENFDNSLNLELVFALLKSSESFPIDFDDAWQWIGYSRKAKALRTFKNNFTEGLDFYTKGCKSPTGGRPSEWIVLTVDCFKSFAMMAGTSRGKEVRRYFLQCEAELKRRLETRSVGFRPDIEQECRAWQQRYDVRIYLKDQLRPELMNAVVVWAREQHESPRKLAIAVHDAMNQRVQGMKSEEIKKANRLSKSSLVRDYFETMPLIDYATINRTAKNAIIDRDVHPVCAVHEACDSLFGLAYTPKPALIVENLYVQGRKLKAARNQKRLSQGQQLSFWDQRSEAS